MLRAEGFTDIRYVDMPLGAVQQAIGRGDVDFASGYGTNFLAALDAGEPIAVLSGVMVGCVEVFAKADVRGIADLKGRSAGVPYLGASAHMLLTLMAAQVGLDPRTDIRWVTAEPAQLRERFENGEVDAYLGNPPESQDLRARHIGHVILNTLTDRPWSQYFCCMLAGNRDYIRNHPVATKRVLRAVLKATDLCATNPTVAAQRLVDGGFTNRYGNALQTLSENGYDKWREYDAEDTLRFFALRLHETGFIKSSPQK
ncbi:MAG: ABC transporter substrate-binding protein, partial [Alphaproteobacteria bacterium]|nr:ABC transporter substrate-binding protein [Alphaproteobacteria bacterium]